MKRSTLLRLACPSRKKCKSDLILSGDDIKEEILYGTIECPLCHSKFPILQGVAILVPNVRAYLLHHAKGISKFVPDEKIPNEFRKEYLAAKSDLDSNGHEVDLESDRVNSLYLMNHYLSVENSKVEWWTPEAGEGSPLIQELIVKYWDHGPLSVVESWVRNNSSVIELGCGVGGLYRKLSGKISSYLGTDSSFQSILLARHLNVGGPYSGEYKIPADLLAGVMSREVDFGVMLKEINISDVDYVVSEMEALPFKNEIGDISVSLNVIDMLDDPRTLADAQFRLTKKGGVAIQSCPYIWNAPISKRLRAILPPRIKDSARAAEWIYEKAGFKIERHLDHVPWIFFKHLRQIELYSVNIFEALKP